MKRGAPVGRRYHSFRPSAELNLKDRRDRVAQVKAKSRSRACGQIGHWQGDAQCKKQKVLEEKRETHHANTKPRPGARVVASEVTH